MEKKIKYLDYNEMKDICNKYKVCISCPLRVSISLCYLDYYKNYNKFLSIGEKEVEIKDCEKVVPLKDKKCKEFDSCEDCPIGNIGLDCAGTRIDYEEITLAEIYNKAKEDVDKLKTVIFGEESIEGDIKNE